jgi:DNA-binding transcriptional ArsR family regulator
MGHALDPRVATTSRLDAAAAKAIATTLQALATPSRLLILGFLRDGPATVGELAQAVQMEQSAVSHQLRLLRNLGLVDGERHGRTVVYSLYDNHVAQLLDEAIYHAEHLRLAVPDSPSATG